MHREDELKEYYYKLIKTYLEESDVGRQMVAPLKKGSVVHTDIEGDDRKFELVKVNNKCVFREREARRSELQFVFTRASLDYLLEPPPACVHEMMNRFFDCLLEKDPTKKAELHFKANLIEIMRKGYLRLLMLGGQRAVPTLISIGVDLPHWVAKTAHHHH